MWRLLQMLGPYSACQKLLAKVTNLLLDDIWMHVFNDIFVQSCMPALINPGK